MIEYNVKLTTDFPFDSRQTTGKGLSVADQYELSLGRLRVNGVIQTYNWSHLRH